MDGFVVFESKKLSQQRVWFIFSAHLLIRRSLPSKFLSSRFSEKGLRRRRWPISAQGLLLKPWAEDECFVLLATLRSCEQDQRTPFRVVTTRVALLPQGFKANPGL